MLTVYGLSSAVVSHPTPPSGTFTDRYAYELNQFRQATQRLQSQGEQVRGASVSAVLPVYTALRTETEHAADALRKLHPPSSAKTQYGVVVDLLDRQADLLGQAISQARTGQAQALATSLRAYAVLVSDWLTARQRLATALKGA